MQAAAVDKQTFTCLQRIAGNVKQERWNMDMKLRRNMHLAYVADEAVVAEQIRCREILQKLNFADRSDFAGIAEIVKELLGKSDDAWINPPFYCDYGFNIEVGRNFFANYNCTIIDVAKVKIGDICRKKTGCSGTFV